MRGSGRCFELAVRYQWKNPSWTLVHGYAQLLKTIPLLMAHAWLEKAGLVCDPTQKEPLMPVRRYRRLYRARAEQRYRAREVQQLLQEQGHFGPWGACRHDILPLQGRHSATRLRDGTHTRQKIA